MAKFKNVSKNISQADTKKGTLVSVKFENGVESHYEDMQRKGSFLCNPQCNAIAKQVAEEIEHATPLFSCPLQPAFQRTVAIMAQVGD